MPLAVLRAAQKPKTDLTGGKSLSDGPAPANLLTVNVEDYFQVGVFKKYIQSDNWYRFESRLNENVDKLLQLLDEHDTQATFFVLGWTAEHQPELVRLISDAGHEVASRGYLHQPLMQLPRDEVRRDLERSRAAIEAVTGTPVDGFRLSDGWLTKESLWLLDEVAATGFRYDSSLMPRRRDFSDALEWRTIREIETANGPLWEVPLSTLPVFGGWMPVAGGNYLRQMPDFLMRRFVDRVVSASDEPYVMYFQVWELDNKQPELSVASPLTRVRHYRKLGKYLRILPEYLKRYPFTSIRSHARNSASPLHALIEDGRFGCRSNESIERSADRTLSHVREVTAVDSIKFDDLAVEKTDITIVIPCYNEEKTVPYLANTLASVKELLSKQYSPRILFVDDCSSDETHDALNQQFGDDPSVRVIRHEENKGVSAAILTGLSAADTEVVCSMDCDCSYDPHVLAEMLPLLEADVSLVTASPYHKRGLVRNVPGWRLILSKGLSALYQRLLKQELATWTACFRIYRRDMILDLPLQESGFLGTAELAAHLVLRQRRIVEHPATLEVRLFGISKMKTVRAILSHLKLLCRIAALRFGRGTNKTS